MFINLLASTFLESDIRPGSFSFSVLAGVGASGGASGGAGHVDVAAQGRLAELEEHWQGRDVNVCGKKGGAGRAGDQPPEATKWQLDSGHAGGSSNGNSSPVTRA